MAKFSDILDNTDSYVLGDNKKKTSRASQQVLDRVNEIRSGLKREDERLHQTRPKKTIGKYSDILDIETEQLGKDKELPDIPFVFPDNLFKKEQKLETPLAKEETGQQISSENIFDILSRTRPPFTGSEPITEPVIEQRTEKQPTFNILDFANKQKQEIDELRKEYDSAGGIETQIDINKAINENVGKELNKILEFPALKPIKESLERLAKNSGYQRQIESARYVKLLRMKEEAKRLGADTGYYDSEIAKLKENLDQPEFRRFSENILATAQLGISVIPKMMLLNAASEPAMKLTGNIAESIGGKELRPITETLTHFGLTATLGLPVLIGSLTSMGADYVADKLLQGTELNEKDKALILEAVQHFSFIGGLAAGSKAKTSVKNFLDTEKTMESIFDARTKAEKKAAEKRLKELRKINQERPLTSDELKEYRYLQKPREVIFGTPGIETIARYEKTLGRPLTKQEQKIVDIYNKRQEDIRNNPDEAYSREETRLYEDKVRKIREESGEEIIDVYKLLYPEEFGEIEAPKTPKAEETTRIRGLLGEETPPPVLRRGVPPEPLSGITLEEEAKLLNEAANKIARGNDDKLTEAEIEVRDRYPNYVKNLAEEIRQTPEFKEEYKLKRQAEKRRIKDETTSYSDLVREFRHAQKKGMLFDSPDIRESIDAIVTPEIRTKAENLHKEISDYNEKRIKKNELTLENLSRRKYKTSDLNKLTQQQQTDLLNEFNEMKKQGINEFNQIQKHRPVLQKIKEEDYAVPESKAESLLQRKPEEIRETGGGRGGVEPSIGRIETAPEEKAGEEKIIKKPSKEETRSITKSYQGGGQGYSKVKLNQEAIDKIGLENFNKYAKKYIEDNISRKNLPEDRTLAEAYLIEEFRNRVVNEEPQLLKDYPDLQKKTEPVKELRGRDLFTQEELRRFDAQNIDVSKVPAKYKEEALQQLAFKEKGTMKNEDVRKEYDREERNRLISDMNLDVASGLRDRIEKFYEKKLDEFSVKELKQIQKAIEAGETFYEAEEKPIEPKKEPEASGDFIKIPINELRTSLKDFQGRQREYSKQTYDRIITEAESGELNISGIPPIQIWKNPKTGEYNILAGHSRTKAFGDIYKGRIIDPQTGKARAPRLDPKYKTSQFGKINAQIVKANTLEEAVKIAQESNQGAIQTDIENAKYFKKLREKFGSKAEMENKARQLYGSNAQRIIDYSYLAEGGNTWEALKQFGLTSEQESKDVIKRIAQYIGRARKLYPSLTDSHENELYSWLNEGASQKLNMADFIGRIENIVLRPDFNPVSPLNIANRVTKGYYERTVDNQIKEVTAEIKKLEAERSSKTNPPSEARLNKISEEIGYLNKELAKLLNDLRSAKEADRQQTELFGSIEESVKEGVLSNEKVEEIISTTDTEELSKFAEDIERKAEDAESKQSIEKAEQVIKEIDEGVLDLSKESLKAEGTKGQEEIKPDIGEIPADPVSEDAFNEALARIKGKGNVAFQLKPGKEYQPTEEYHIDYGGREPRIPAEELKDYVTLGAYIYQNGIKDVADWKQKFTELVGKIDDNKLEKIYQAMEDRYGQQFENIKDLKQGEPTTDITGTDVSGISGGTSIKQGERPGLITIDKENIPKPKSYVGADRYSGELDEDQRLAVNLALTRFLDKGGKGFMLADGTGVGKTRSIIATANEYNKITNEPVLIISKSKTILYNNFEDDAYALGIDLDKFELGTYRGLTDGLFSGKEYGLVIFDESQELKNLTAEKTQASLDIKAKHKLFATATPTDKLTGAAYFFAEITGKTEKEIAEQLGYEISYEWDAKAGIERKYTYLLKNYSWDDVLDNLIKLRETAIKEGSLIRREYPFYGEVKFFNVDLGEEYRKNADTAYWWFQDKIDRAIKSKTKRDISGQRTLSLGRYTESLKVDKVFELMKQDLAEGKSVIIFAEGINPSTIRGVPTAEGVDKYGKRFPYHPFNGFIGELGKKLEAEGIEWAKIYGSSPERKAKEIRKFQSGEYRVAISTPQSGGSGINADDQVGDKPRVAYLVSINFAGDVNEQIFGRISRRNTKSPSLVKVIVSLDSFSDNRKYETLKKKMQVLRRIQAGEDPDIATGFDVDTDLEEIADEQLQLKPVNKYKVQIERLEKEIADIQNSIFPDVDKIRSLGNEIRKIKQRQAQEESSLGLETDIIKKSKIKLPEGFSIKESSLAELRNYREQLSSLGDKISDSDKELLNRINTRIKVIESSGEQGSLFGPEQGELFSLKTPMKDSFGNDVPKHLIKAQEYIADSKILQDINNFDIEIREPVRLNLTADEIRGYGYSDDFIKTLDKLEEGDTGYERGKEKYAVEAEGANYYDTKTGRWKIAVSSRATPSAYAEEIIHQIQRGLDKISPEMAQRIKEWENDVRTIAKENGIGIPEGYETFAQAMVFTHLGYAGENPDVAELYEVPKDIRDWFVKEVLDQSVSGRKNLSELLKGGSERRAIRLPEGKTGKELNRGIEQYNKLRQQRGERADIYPEWQKQMVKEFGGGIRKTDRKLWNEIKAAERIEANTRKGEQQNLFDNDLELFSVRNDKKDLLAINNLTADNLAFADKVGGMAMPSMAIVNKNLGLSKYGEITLVANKRLIEPERGTKVYNRDVYSPTYPIIYRHIDNARLAEKIKEIKEIIPAWALKEDGYNIARLKEDIETGKYEIGDLKNNAALKHYYLQKTKQLPEPRLRNERLKYLPESDDQYKIAEQIAEKIPEIRGGYGQIDVEFIKSKAEEYFEDDNFYKNLSEDQRRELSLERAEEKEYEARQKEREKIIKRFVNDYIDEYFKRRYKSDNIHFKELKEKLKNTTNAYNFSKDVDKLLSPKQELDYYKYNDKDVEPLIEEQKEKYLSFLKEDFDNIFGSEYILKGKKKIPHTLNNAVEVMGSKIKGAQKTLIQGLGKSAGEAAKKFTSTASIIKNKNQIVSQKEFEIAEDKLKTAFFKLSDRLRAYSTDKSEFGWDRLDNLSKAISQIAKKNPSDGYIRNYLWRNGYKDVPEYLYDDIREVVNMMKEMPTEYFEAKKERIVGLNEFVGAIVPDNVSKNTLEILEKNGIRRIKTYKFLDNEDRQRALNTFTDEMFSVRDEGTTIYDDTGTLVENERVKDVIKYRDKSALLTGESIVVHDKIRPVVFPKAVWIKKGYNPEKFNFKKLSEGDKGYVEGEERYLAYVEGSEQEGRIDIYGDTVETHGIAEEVIHKFQRKVETRNPKLAKKIKRWERAVRKAFIKQMNYNPSDKELTEFFAKSFLIDYGFPDIEGGAEGIIPENIFNETLDMLNEPIEGITGKIFEEYFPVEQRQLGKVNIPTIEEYTNKDLSLFSASGDLTPKQILTNPGGIYPTPKAIKDAINILGKDFANEFEDFKAGKKERLSRGVEEEGYLLEDFARRTVAAQKLGIEDIEGDIYGKAQELQYQLKGKPADDILRQGNEFYNKLKGRKADTYSEWRKQMLNKYGREIDPKLRGIWKEIKQAELTGIFEESKPYADFEKEQEIIDDWFKRPSPKQAREARIYGTTAASSRSINDMIQKGRANLGGAQPQGFRISDRVKEILKHFNIPIHEKHLSKKYLGVYKHITEGTRVQSIYDIVVVTHEVAHALDHRHKITDKLIAASDRGSQIRKRLTDIYEDLYPGANRSHPIKKRMTEGFATLIEHYFYDPADITKKYPVLVKEFINPSGTYYNQDISTLLAMMNGLVDDYARLEPWQRIASRIRSGKEVVENNDTGFDIFQRLKFEIFNIFEPLERISKLTGTRRTWEDPSVSAFNYLNRATIAYNWLKGDKAPLLKTNGDWEFKDETVDQYLKKISGKEKQFDSFLVARRDLELYKKIQQLRNINSDVLEALKKAVESGDTKTAHEIIKENPVVYQVHSLEKILRNDNFQLQDMQATVGAFEGQFRDAVKIFDKINQNLIDFSENTGLISSETAEAWRNEKGYASFQRYINDELLEVINKPGSDAQKNLKAKKARTGGTLDIISPVYNQILAISETINKGLNNMIWKKAYDLSKKNKEIARRFEQIETITAVEKGRIIYPQEKDPNLIRVLDNGERVFIRPAKEYVLMKEALAPMENDMFDTLVRIPSQIFIRMTTSANPIFAVANLPIDQVTLAYNTHHGTIPVASTIKNSAYLAQHFADWLQKIRTGQKMGAEGLNEYLLLGGKRQTFASEYDLAPEDLTKVIASDPTLKNKVTKWIDGTISLFELPTNYTEYASRYAEYINAKREGASMSEAMYAAAQATLPFQQYGRMGGSFGRKIVKSIPYFKPALLAVYRYMKATKDNPVRFATLSAGFLTMALTSAAAVMLYGDEEDKRALGNLPAEELSRAMYIPNPMGKGLVRIRIPEQIGAITGLAYLYVIEHYDGNKATFDDYLRTVTSALPRQFNVTQPGEMLFGWTPQILKPGIEVATNTRTYPDLMPIVPQWMEDYYSKKDRYSDYTSYIAKKLGQWGGLSPMEIDYFVKAQFGAVGNFLMGTGDFVQGDFKRLSRINPVTRNENVFALMGRAYNHFYDRKEFYTQQYNELKGEHSYSNAEADRIKLTQKLYNDMAKQLSNARALLKEEKLTKEDKLMIWESLLLLENDRLEEAREMVDKLKSQMPEKERKEAKYNDGEPLPKSGTGSRQPRDTRQSRN